MDNAPSHIDRSRLKFIEEFVYQFTGTNLYFILGRPNRSHVLNSGDQLMNVTLRAHCRPKAKWRLLRHCMLIVDSRLPQFASLDMSEGTMKPLLLLWVSQWIGHS